MTTSRQTTPPEKSSSDSASSLLLTNHCHDSGSTARTLADLPMDMDVPLFRRKDLEIGCMLGRGRFSQVHAIHRVSRPSPSSNGTTSATDGTSTEPLITTQQDCSYVMKHIQNRLFATRGQRRFAKDLTNAIADLVTEAMYLCKLKHPHIVKLRGLTLGGTSVLKRREAVGADYFLLLDRMEETLDQRIHWTWKKEYGTAADQGGKFARQPLSLALDKTTYAWQMADALSYLHDHQIIYRDLKPENVGFILDNSAVEPQDKYKLQLFDFGLARELEEPVTNESRLYALSASGTCRYMAPEVFNLPGKYNYKADVFSWSMCCFEMMSHTKPFALFNRQLHEELVCRLGGRPKMTDILWPEECDSEEVAAKLAEDWESLLQAAWTQSWYERLSMAQVCERVQAILKTQGVGQRRQRLSAKLQSLSSINHGTKKSNNRLSESTSGSDDTAAMSFSQNKASASELTVATETMASDSEFDDDRGRWSQSSIRSSISSKGTVLVRE